MKKGGKNKGQKWRPEKSSTERGENIENRRPHCASLQIEPVHVWVGAFQIMTLSEEKWCYLYLPRDSVFWDISPDIASKVWVCFLLHAGLLLGLHFETWRWRQHIRPKRRLPPNYTASYPRKQKSDNLVLCDNRYYWFLSCDNNTGWF
jgi:hypothetical protein